MTQPTLSQMKARINSFHREVLSDALTGLVRSGMSREYIKAYSRAKRTLFAWGCLQNGPMERNSDMTTRYPLIITATGRTLL